MVAHDRDTAFEKSPLRPTKRDDKEMLVSRPRVFKICTVFAP
jgi:hypothetical protein